MKAKELLEELGYEGVTCFENYSYDTTLIGITVDNKAVYSYEKMVEWLMETEDFSEEEANDWINYNTIRALPYIPNAPIIVYEMEMK